jgi:hypothetical protein
MKIYQYLLLVFAFLFSAAGCTTTGTRNPGPVIDSYGVINIDPTTNTPDLSSSGNNIGSLDADNPGAGNNKIFRKRFTMALKPNNTTIDTTHFEISYMSPTSTAMANPMSMDPPTRSLNSDGSILFTSRTFSPPSNANVCDWMHYRWSVNYSKPDGTNGVLIGQVQTLQMNGVSSLSGGGIHPESRVCDPIPQE